MNKSKIIMYTTIGIMSLILVYVMFIQFRIVNETDTQGVEFMRETELKETLAKYKTKYQETEDELIDVQAKIDEYKENEESEEATVLLLEKELKDTNMKLGLTKVTGEGITITIEKRDERDVTPTALLSLVNELLLAGAEAISINDQRIVAMSDIVNPSNFIMINGERIIAPYTVKAIGDTTHLQSALTVKGGYVDINSEDYSINIKTGNVTIEKYDGNLSLDYAEK